MTVTAERGIGSEEPQSTALSGAILRDLGSGYIATPGRIVIRGGDGGESDFVGSTIDIKRAGVLNSGRRLLGAQTVLRLCGKLEATVVALPFERILGAPDGKDNITTIQILSPGGALDATTIVARRRSIVPDEIVGYIVSRKNQGRLPSAVIARLEEAGIPGYHRAADFRYRHPIPTSI